jgi:putative spermidine/putrescine transport system permease protein
VIGRLLLNGVTALVIVFLIGPLLIIMVGSFTTTTYITFPPQGFTLHWYRELLLMGDLLDATITSLSIAALASVAATVIGTLAALALAQAEAVGREQLRLFAIAPLVFPTVVTGVALYSFVRGIDLESAFVALLIGHTLITVPYVVRNVGAALDGLDPALAEAAEGLGAGWMRIGREVLLPALAPSLLVSILLVFVVSFDQVSISIFLADSGTTTLPVQIYSYLEWGLDPRVAAISSITIVMAYVVVVAVQRLIGLDRVFGRAS